MSVRQRIRTSEGIKRKVWVIDIDFHHVDGRRQRVRQVAQVQTRDGAKREELQIRMALQAGTYMSRQDEEARVPTLGEFAEAFLVASRSSNKPSTTKAKEHILKHHLLPRWKDTPLDEIGPEEIAAFKVAQLENPNLGPKSINNQLIELRRLLNLAQEYGKIQKVPQIKMLKYERPKIEFFEESEAERMLEKVDPRHQTMVIVALKSGLRIGELLALKWVDVDLKLGLIRVHHSVWGATLGLPKGGRTREVPLPPSAVQALRAHKHLRGPYVFCHEDGRPLTASAVQYTVLDACKRAGLAKSLTWHALRHSYASHLVMKGVPLKAVADLLGHASTNEVTERYAHLSPTFTREAVQVLDTPKPAAPERHRDNSES